VPIPFPTAYCARLKFRPCFVEFLKEYLVVPSARAPL
jgi:hypothetical protein